MNKKGFERSVTRLANAAFRQAAEKVIERAEATGTTIVVWEDGRIKELEPREARARLKKRKGKQVRRGTRARRDGRRGEKR